MLKPITCFISDGESSVNNDLFKSFMATSLVEDVFVFSGQGKSLALLSSETMKEIAGQAQTEYVLLYFKSSPIYIGQDSLHRMVQIAVDTGAGVVYADYYQQKRGDLLSVPLTDYQVGSLRDDFNFGSLVLLNTSLLKSVVSQMQDNFQFAGWYDVRLRLSKMTDLIRIPEFLYTEIETDVRESGEKQFDYVDPRNRAVQIEMELVCSEFLKSVGGWLEPSFKQIDLKSELFEFEASVVIPVKNRVKTISDAIQSVLIQEAYFRYNVIIVDNHSTDGTTDIIKEFVKNDDRVIHLTPQRTDLGIGGCWNAALEHEKCGRFAIQLDSDDLYIDSQVLVKIVKTFYEQKCAMVIGSYQVVNFKLMPISPGLIDHKEWTPENGHNNALRINGLGAPRAFYTPLLRKVKVPNVSYGEDYAVGLRISREYQIGRIYDPLYLCRRWDDNSDAALDTAKINQYNAYKDCLRTIELKARMQMNNVMK
ncbi:MAG: glycosyltransferase family 2 protein [Marinilabiliaceae bacterium]|nr:glycosyltransferase family 2 protein [Marinilabiliaceae bacterium]